MRDYQAIKNNPYLLPQTLYRRIIGLVRDYDRLKEQYHEILHESPEPPDGQPRGTRKSDPTERKAMRLAVISAEMQAVEQALVIVPPEYREDIMDNIICGARYPDYTGVRTYQRWKQRFIYGVAWNLMLV